MSSILIYHHLGLGDHIMVHGIIREYSKKYSKVGFFSKPHNVTSVAFMFRDLKNIKIIIDDEKVAESFILANSKNTGSNKYDEIKIIGYQNLDRRRGIMLEQQLYDIAGLDLMKKWDSFYVERDLLKETSLFEKIVHMRNYVFFHEDASRNFKINRNKINKRYTIIEPDPKITDNFFDYCTVIEKAKEIHVIDSSFMFLIDCLPYDNPEQKLYVHRYSRENDDWKLPILKKNWHIIMIESYNKKGLIKYARRMFRKYKLLIHRFVFDS